MLHTQSPPQLWLSDHFQVHCVLNIYTCILDSFVGILAVSGVEQCSVCIYMYSVLMGVYSRLEIHVHVYIHVANQVRAMVKFW